MSNQRPYAPRENPDDSDEVVILDDLGEEELDFNDNDLYGDDDEYPNDSDTWFEDDEGYDDDELAY